MGLKDKCPHANLLRLGLNNADGEKYSGFNNQVTGKGLGEIYLMSRRVRWEDSYQVHICTEYMKTNGQTTSKGSSRLR